jgi:3-deoxy-D-manno-octulosonate 8-phosphate phosphatase KdsC-like HAD superfamily phosphatase
VLFGVQSNSDALKKLSKKKLFNLDRTLYVGNDLNDYEALIYVVTQHALLIAIKRLKKFQHLNLTLKVDWV